MSDSTPSRILAALLPLLLASSACDSKAPAGADTGATVDGGADGGGGDAGGGDAGDTGVDTGGCAPPADDERNWLDVPTYSMEWEKGGPSEEPASTLVATSPAPGVVDVQHIDVENEGCGTLCVIALWEDDNLFPFYTFGGEAGPGPGPCIATLTYQLTGVPAGSWTVQARGDSAQVVVE